MRASQKQFPKRLKAAVAHMPPSEECFVCTQESSKQLPCARPTLAWVHQRNQPHLFSHPLPALGPRRRGGRGGACVQEEPPAWELISKCLPLSTGSCKAKGFCFENMAVAEAGIPRGVSVCLDFSHRLEVSGQEPLQGSWAPCPACSPPPAVPAP